MEGVKARRGAADLVAVADLQDSPGVLLDLARDLEAGCLAAENVNK